MKDKNIILEDETYEEIFDADEMSEWDDYSSTFPWNNK